MNERRCRRCAYGDFRHEARRPNRAGLASVAAEHEPLLGTRGKSRHIGAKGKAYRLETLSAWNRPSQVQGFGHARLHVAVQAFPPDRQAQDLTTWRSVPSTR